MPTPTEADAIIATARSWLGVPWIHQGRSRRGIDCVGLILVTLAELGHDAKDMQGYRRAADPEKFLTHIREQTDYLGLPEPGALLIFRQGLTPCHVGIATERYGQPYFIHSFARAGKVVEEPFNHPWPNLLVEARTFRI